jgi:hypothetical protein
VLLDADVDARVSPQQLTRIVADQPRLAQAMVTLHRRYRHAVEQLGQLSDDGTAPLMPHEQVREFFYSNTYLDAVDTAAERLATELNLRRHHVREALAARLRERHRVRVVEREQQSIGSLHRFDADTGVLVLPSHLRRTSRRSGWPANWVCWSSCRS